MVVFAYYIGRSHRLLCRVPKFGGVTVSDQPEITFALAPRLQTDGQIAIILHLYKGKRRALSTTLTTCARQSAPDAMQTCRSHLRKLGVSETRSISRLPEASSLV